MITAIPIRVGTSNKDFFAYWLKCIQRLKRETRPLRKGNPTAKKGKEPILK